jgi:alkylhydroperoxidase/carboxymuconolactone decarboxylase family protein YurZ
MDTGSFKKFLQQYLNPFTSLRKKLQRRYFSFQRKAIPPVTVELIFVSVASASTTTFNPPPL